MTEYSFSQWYNQNSQLIKIDLASGTLAGISLCIVGYPMDTVKVRMQATSYSILKTIKIILQDGGPLAFFNGMKFPVMTVPFTMTACFTAYQLSRRYFLIQQNGNELLGWQIITCGAFAGTCQSFVSCPVELVKCRLQMQSQQYLSYQFGYVGPKDVLQRIITQEGVRQLYRGMFSTWFRETVGTMAKKWLPKLKGLQEPSSFDLLLSGGIGGLTCWIISYPQDLIKTILQCETATHKSLRKFKPFLFDGGFFSCFHNIWQKSGMMGFWKGLTPCLARAFFANAANFYVFEKSKAFFLLQTY